MTRLPGSTLSVKSILWTVNGYASQYHQNFVFGIGRDGVVTKARLHSAWFDGSDLVYQRSLKLSVRR